MSRDQKSVPCLVIAGMRLIEGFACCCVPTLVLVAGAVGPRFVPVEVVLRRGEIWFL